MDSIVINVLMQEECSYKGNGPQFWLVISKWIYLMILSPLMKVQLSFSTNKKKIDIMWKILKIQPVILIMWKKNLEVMQFYLAL